MANRTVSVALKMLIGDYVSNADKAARATDGIGKSAEKSAAQYKRGAQTIVAGAGIAAIAGAGALFKMASASMGFEKAMSGVAAVSNATAGELQSLRQAALDAGADTAFSASQAAEAEAELAKAGISTADILGGALRGSLDLAAAGQLNLGRAAEISAQAMNIFSLKGKDVGHIADVLAAGANKSAADVDGLAQAMQQGGQVAASMGLSLEDTVGTLALFADAGLNGSDAGTSLKTALQRLAAPAAEGAEAMRSLGLYAFDAGGNFVGMTNFAGQLQQKLGKLTSEQRNQALATIFGADAVRAANILFKAGATGVADYTKSVNDTGAAGRMAAKQLDNLSGDVEALSGSIETTLIKSGSSANGILRGMTQAATGAVNVFGDLPGPVQGGAVAMLALGTAAAGTVAALGIVVPKIHEGRTALREMGKAGQVADRSLARVGKGMVVGSAALAGLATAGVLLKQLQDAAFGAAPGVEQVKSALLDAGDAGRLSAALPKLADGYGNLGAQIQRLADPSLGDGARKTLTTVFTLGQADPSLLRAAKENIGSIDQALADLVTSGHPEEAAKAFKAISEQANQQGASLNQVKEVLPRYKDALAGVANDSQLAADGIGKSGDAAAGAAKPMSRLEKEARALGLEFTDGASAADLMKSAIDRLNGASLGALDTDIAFRESLAKVTEAFKENGKTLDINTAAGRANLSTISESIKSASGHAQAVAEQTGSIEKGNTTFARHIAQLRATALAAGLPRAEVERLIKTYGRVPQRVNTNVVTKGAAQAKSSANAVEEAMRRIPARRSTSLVTTGAAQAVSSANAVEQAMSRIPRRVTTYVATIYSSSTAAEHGLGRRAGGGSVSPNKAYLVGEEGPEVLTMGAAGGWVTPNHMLPASVSSGYSGGGTARGGGGAAAGGGGRLVLELRSGGSRMDDLLVDVLQKAIGRRGGDVQAVLGRG